MRVADFVLVLPVIYVVLVLRAVLPLVLAAVDGVPAGGRGSSSLVGWPFVAKGVRAIVAVERESRVRAGRAVARRRARCGSWRCT